MNKQLCQWSRLGRVTQVDTLFEYSLEKVGACWMGEQGAALSPQGDTEAPN